MDSRYPGVPRDLAVTNRLHQPGFYLPRAAQHRLCRDANPRMNAADLILALRKSLKILFFTGQDLLYPSRQRAAQTFLNQLIREVSGDIRILKNKIVKAGR
ncbi:Uncharacterised protein [Klebsiella pneumoniae]|nr:Uncharacterised protein [Klebsiella pneumoniae]SVP31932.1 Uncharacterised protein [Klebsiella pneumoniae]VGP78451.1 hypothetical protein SB00612_05052 [Klebsiella pneumoniae]